MDVNKVVLTDVILEPNLWRAGTSHWVVKLKAPDNVMAKDIMRIFENGKEALEAEPLLAEAKEALQESTLPAICDRLDQLIKKATQWRMTRP